MDFLYFRGFHLSGMFWGDERWSSCCALSDAKHNNNNKKVIHTNSRHLQIRLTPYHWQLPLFYVICVDHRVDHRRTAQDVLEELDPSIEPVLSKAVIKQGNRDVVKLGDKELDWSSDFRLYITTKLGNPHYTPEVPLSRLTFGSQRWRLLLRCCDTDTS